MKSVIIIGAGPAGLTAAYEFLTKTTIKPIILETESQVGGLSKTVDYNGNLIDIGGHRFFSKSDKIIEWWLKFMPLEQVEMDGDEAKYQDHTSKQNSCDVDDRTPKMLLRQRKSRIYFDKKFYDYPLKFNLKTLKNIGIVEIGKIIASYGWAKVNPITPENSLADFFINRFGNVLYKRFFADYTKKVWGRSCDEIPASWGHQRIKDLNFFKTITDSIRSIWIKDRSLSQTTKETSLIEQFMYPQLGPGQLWEEVAQKIIELGGEIRLNSSVTQLLFNAENSLRSCFVKDKLKEYEYELPADLFVSTMPLKDLIYKSKNLNIPANIRSIAEGLLYRDFIIVGILLTGFANSEIQKELVDNWIYIQDKGVTAGRMQIFNNWSPFMSKYKENTWIGIEYFTNESEYLWNCSDQEITAFSINEIVNIGLITNNAVLDTTVIRVKKAYPSYNGTYSGFPELQEFLDTLPNLYVIGRNGMHRYNNSDHSMLTAMEMVANIKEHRSDRSNIWSVNTEKQYHEEK